MPTHTSTSTPPVRPRLFGLAALLFTLLATPAAAQISGGLEGRERPEVSPPIVRSGGCNASPTGSALFAPALLLAGVALARRRRR